MQDTEQRLIELETKLAYQDDTVLALNDVVARQQLEIEKLSAVVKLLVERVRRLTAADESADPTAEEIPPHY